MSISFPALTTLNPQQFVGYWGYGQQTELAKLLMQSIRSRSGSQALQQVASPDTQLAWGWWVLCVASAPTSIPSQLETLHLALSASGLPNTQDAWVHLHPTRLILGREGFGRMPLYWFQQGNVIWFASQLQLLLPLLPQSEVSLAGLYGYSCFSYVPTPHTPIAQISALPTDTEQTWQCNEADQTIVITTQRSQPWQEASDQIQDEAVAIDQLQPLLKTAIQQQIADINDEPVGIFLSGGLDSAAIAALLVQAGVKVRAYTLDFGAAGIPELPYAAQVAKFLGIPLVKVSCTPSQVRKALIPTVQALNLPFGDGVTVPLFLLAQAASQEVRIIFNGEGGDQLFAGWTNKPLIAASVYQPEKPNQTTFVQQYLSTFHRLWGYEAQIFQPDVYAQIQLVAPEDWLEDALDPAYCTALLHRLRRATLLLKGAQNIHPRATNLGLAHGLQVRSPFCNLTLAQWTFHLSGSLCLQGSCEKYILKRAVESWLPPEVVWRSKRGMGVPLTAWCLNELWHEVGNWLNPNRLRAEGFWQPDLASRIVSGQLGTIHDRRIGEILWLLMMWQIWTQTFLKKPLPAPSFNHPFWLPAWLGKPYLRLHRTLEQW
jgi:asparagine synthase (glutamine-hydrolysing)